MDNNRDVRNPTGCTEPNWFYCKPKRNGSPPVLNRMKLDSCIVDVSRNWIELDRIGVEFKPGWIKSVRANGPRRQSTWTVRADRPLGRSAQTIRAEGPRGRSARTVHAVSWQLFLNKRRFPQTVYLSVAPILLVQRVLAITKIVYALRTPPAPLFWGFVFVG